MTDETALDSNRNFSSNDLDVLLKQARRLPGRRKFRGCLITSGVIIAFITAMIVLGDAGYLTAGWPALVALVVTIGAGLWVWFAAERRDLRTIEALAMFRDKRTLGVLLDAANCTNRLARERVHAALADVLRGLTEADSSLLNTSHREMLNGLIYGKSGDLSLAALSSIEQIGDGTALPYLTSMAAGKGIPDMLKSQRAEVQACAEHAVERIRERIEKQNRANVLLRAAHMPETPSEQLVRPAFSQHQGNVHELLRPEENGEQDKSEREERL